MRDAQRRHQTGSKPLELRIEREFDAPRDLVFRAWSDAEHVRHWWGPRDFEVTSARVDFRVGGTWNIDIRSPDGKVYGAEGIYREIVELERLVFTFAWDGAHGQPIIETLVTVVFDEAGEKTRLIFHQTPFESLAERDGHTVGWEQCLERLAAYLDR